MREPIEYYRRTMQPSPAPDFVLADHQQQPYTLSRLLGERGVLLGFVGDIWLPSNVERVHWLGRNAHRFAQRGVRAALLVTNQSHTLHNFYASSPLPLQLPLLADVGGMVRARFGVEPRPRIALIDRQQRLCMIWSAWPTVDELLGAIDLL